MTKESMNSLTRGDLVRSKSTERTYVVTASYGDRVTAVDTVDITNPDEWEFVAAQPRTEDEIRAYQKSVGAGR